MDLQRACRKAWRFGALAIFTGLATAAHAKPLPETGFGFPRDASVHGHRIDWLIEVTGAFVALLFIVMCAWMLWACLKHGEKHEPHYEHGDTKKNVLTALVISSLIFLVVDGNLFYHSVKDVGEVFWNWDAAEAEPDVVRIQVNAHQWAWDIRYAGHDGVFNTPDDIVTLNDMRVPIGQPVVIQLAATDVIHSFYLPNFRVKTDAVPGTINPLWFEAKELGEYDIACAQHCGMAHYLMRGLITVLPQEEYRAWADHASNLGLLTHDPADATAHWGWPWQEEL